MPAETFARIVSLPPVASIWAAAPISHPNPHKRKDAHLDVHKPLLVAIAPEGVAVLLAPHVDALPPQLLDRDERLVDVRVLGDEVRPEVHGKALRVQDVRRRLREVCFV